MNNSTAMIVDDLHDQDDGSVSLGPLLGFSLPMLQRKMELHGVFAFHPTCNVSEITDDGHLEVSATSENVRGYFVDEEGYEASSSDMENFLLDILEPGSSLDVQGRYPDGDGGSIVTRSKFANLNGEIIADVDRQRFLSDGTRMEIINNSDLSDREVEIQAEVTGNVIIFDRFLRKA